MPLCPLLPTNESGQKGQGLFIVVLMLIPQASQHFPLFVFWSHATGVYLSRDFKFHPHLPFLSCIFLLSLSDFANPYPARYSLVTCPYNPEVYGLWAKSAGVTSGKGVFVTAFGPFINTESSRSCILHRSTQLTETDTLSSYKTSQPLGLNLCHSVRSCAWAKCTVHCIVIIIESKSYLSSYCECYSALLLWNLAMQYIKIALEWMQ